MRVCPLPGNFDGAGYYRVLFPARELALRGAADVLQVPRLVQRKPGGLLVHYGEFVKDPGGVRCVKSVGDWLLDASFDVLSLNQRPEPEWDGLIRKLQAQGRRVVVDSDDDWFNVPAWNPASGRPRAEVDSMKKMLAAADAVTVATPALAELYGPLNPNVAVVRNTLDWHMWEHIAPVYEQERRRFRVGWMGDSKWRTGDLAVLRGVIGPWLERNRDVEFVAAGDHKVHDLLGVPKRQRVTVASTQFHELDLADITAVMDVGLVPLVQGRFNDGKSHLKGLEYAACGIPCVATPTESYRWWVEPGVNGLLAGKPQQWRDALDVMRENWRAMGRAARAKAAEHTIQERWHEWETVYRGEDPRGRVGAAMASCVAEAA